MKDLALVAALVLLLAASWAAFLLFSRLVRRAGQGDPATLWRIDERSDRGRTYVRLQRVVRRNDGLTSVDDVREVGSVADDDPDYDDKLLTLRALAQQRMAVVADR